MSKAKVAIIRTRPETVLDDVVRLFELADGPAALYPGTCTILKDNISWHYPFPSANTTPWQLEGTILALRKHGFSDLVCVQNKTEVTDAFKGEDLNGYKPIFKAHGIEVRFNFKDEDMGWVPYKPKARMRALDDIYGDRPADPRFFRRPEHRPSADGQVPHLHDDDRGDEKRLRRPAQPQAPPDPHPHP